MAWGLNEVCSFVWTDKLSSESQLDRRRDRETDRQASLETEKQTIKKVKRQRYGEASM